MKQGLKQHNRERLAVTLLALLCLLWIPNASADELFPDQSITGGELIALTEGDELSEELLGTIRGQGTRSETPDLPAQLGVILWDEGGVNKGGRNTQGYSNSVVTVKVYLEGS